MCGGQPEDAEERQAGFRDLERGPTVLLSMKDQLIAGYKRALDSPAGKRPLNLGRGEGLGDDDRAVWGTPKEFR